MSEDESIAWSISAHRAELSYEEMLKYGYIEPDTNTDKSFIDFIKGDS